MGTGRLQSSDATRLREALKPEEDQAIGREELIVFVAISIAVLAVAIYLAVTLP